MTSPRSTQIDCNESVYGATPLEWVKLVRRARIGQARKLAALIFASYADVSEHNGRKPGEGIHCGIARLATDLECSYATAQRHLRWLRDVGLIERTYEGSPRRGLSDEYRLIVSAETVDRLGIPDPEEYKQLVGAVARSNRIKSSRVRSDLTKAEVRTGVLTSPADASDLTQVRSHQPETPTLSLTNPEVAEHRTDLTPPGAPAPSTAQDQKSRGTARDRCPDHPAMPGGVRAPGEPACPVCRALDRRARPRLTVIPGGQDGS